MLVVVDELERPPRTLMQSVCPDCGGTDTMYSNERTWLDKCVNCHPATKVLICPLCRFASVHYSQKILGEFYWLCKRCFTILRTPRGQTEPLSMLIYRGYHDQNGEAYYWTPWNPEWSTDYHVFGKPGRYLKTGSNGSTRFLEAEQLLAADGPKLLAQH